MTLVFCDTSGLYAVGNREDAAHAAAAEMWGSLVTSGRHRLVTTNYVLVEAFSLVQRRNGIDAARTMLDAVNDIVETSFVDAALHALAMQDCLQNARRDVSLVDCVSFAFMRRHEIRAAFAFDERFTENGFDLPTLE